MKSLQTEIGYPKFIAELSLQEIEGVGAGVTSAQVSAVAGGVAGVGAAVAAVNPVAGAAILAAAATIEVGAIAVAIFG